MAKVGLYRGFSSFEFERVKEFSINDVELVKIDLLNHIYTRRGERVMMPKYGTRIPEMVFEPLDDDTLEIIRTDLEIVFDSDPRVETMTLIVTPDYDQNAVRVQANLLYIELNMTGLFNLNIQFNS